MAATGTGSWIKFFKDAGLPSSAAATYALTFTDNRIRMDMLLDLNKEILKDMGINLMGDVIAILRHARAVHEQAAREKVLAVSPSTTSPVAKTAISTVGRLSPTNSSDSGNSSPHVTIGDTTPKQRHTAMSRMVQHYVRPADTIGPSAKDAPVAKTITKVVTGIKRKVKPKEIAPPLKKVRRVLPEHEGKYDITMPSGSTPRSQQILAKQRLLPTKKNVFERLGEGSVSSTTGTTDGRLITITGLGATIVKSNTDKQSSVFSRLGDKQRVTSSTAPDLDEEEEDEEEVEDPTPYAGVFKLPTKKTVVQKKLLEAKKKEEATMRADAESSSVVKKKVLLHSRLGSGSQGSRLVKQKGMLSTVVRAGSTMKVKKVRHKTAGILVGWSEEGNLVVKHHEEGIAPARSRPSKDMGSIRANPTNATKLSVKSRLGGSSEGSAVLSTTTVKRKPQPIVYNNPVPAVPKTVTFGTVTKKLYPKEPAQSTSHPRITMSRPSVFGRLGT